MVRPEWSPNEGYLRKLERLAFALVRTRPIKEPTDTFRSTNNVWLEKTKGLAGPFSLALLVAIPYVTENSSGPIIVASLLLAAVDACITVWCYTDFESRHGHCSGELTSCLFSSAGEFPAFLVGWWQISALSAGFAACCRTLSSIMDSVTGRHVETLMENTLGTFTPLGAPLDIMAVFISAVPIILCALGMEESMFLRTALYVLTSLTTMSIFGSALATSHLFPAVDNIPIVPDRNLYAKILSGASLASIGFLGIYWICKPDNVTLTQHKHFQVVKRFSLAGCVVTSAAFLAYFIESTVLNRVQQTSSLWDGDPPLLWPLAGGWRLAVAALGIAALALATFEFLIPLALIVTSLSNDGLLYRNLRKNEETPAWNSVTPLVFGGISAIQAFLIDTKVLLALASASFMCINIVVCSSMLSLRYQPKPCQSQSQRRSGHTRTRPTPRNTTGNDGQRTGYRTNHTRRLLTVSFLKSGLGKIPRDVMHDIDAARSSGSSGMDQPNDRTCLMDDVGIAPIDPRRESAEFSMGSNVSGYESDSDACTSDATDDTDIDAVVSEYQERIRVATINGAIPMNPTPGTGRRVALSVIALVPCCLALAASLNRAPKGQVTGIMLAISSGLLTFLLLVVISRQPQKRHPLRSSSCSTASGSGSAAYSGPNGGGYDYDLTNSNFLQHSIIPWVPATGIFIHCCLLLEGLDLAGLPFAFWLSTGLIIYFSYGVTKSVAAPPFLVGHERLRLSTSHRQPVLSTVVCGNDLSSTATTSTSSSEPYAQIDTILLP
ncbi:unnamed protein product [Orchesella dallaii]|uniref:Cationic amino acid transporter C-terminal domain-containing protein n=1 Tax=Orchesella dallaii TaxID=48710 RepID=A0ABP1PT27_9HEXA